MKKELKRAFLIAAMGAAVFATPVQAAQHVETGRINQVSFDAPANQYICTATPFGTNNGFVFYLDVQGPENELVTEALNHLIDGNLIELTIDDQGTADIYDDQVVRAIF